MKYEASNLAEETALISALGAKAHQWKWWSSKPVGETKQSSQIVSKNGSVGQTKGSRLGDSQLERRKTEIADDVPFLSTKELVAKLLIAIPVSIGFVR